MRVPLSWIREFTPVDLDVKTLTDVLNSLGLVVEGVEHFGEGLDGVIVGHVLDVRPHPNADRVRLADVDLGDGEPVQIACGGINLAAGQHVPVATIGATLPNGMTIERRKLRGELSNGMICSEDELGLADERSGGIMVLPESSPIGRPFAEVMGIEPDVVFDLEIETNRPDAMCVAGVARDIAAKLGLPFTLPEVSVLGNDTPIADVLTVDVQDTDLCPRFSARVVTQVAVGPSPEKIAKRLTMCGMRPINNVVDASNYVMLELGQPSHPFDLPKVPGATLRVRLSREGEAAETLDGSKRKLPVGSGVIAGDDDSILGVAGIMGGESSEINEQTKAVVLEAAVWNPYSINFTSRKLALRTDASARFERRVDRENTAFSINRIIDIIRLSDPDVRIAQGIIDQSSLQPWPSASDHVRLRTSRVNAILGTELNDDQVRACLEPLGFVVELTEPGIFDVVIPSFRPDNEREIDVIEEVARIFGYDNIVRRVPTAPFAARLTSHQQNRRSLRSFLAGRGCVEAWSAALLGPDDFTRSRQVAKPIALTNPVVKEESLLRTSLLPGMLRTISYNAARQNHELRLFEIGHVFNQPVGGNALPDERERFAVAIVDDKSDARAAAELWRDLCQTLRIYGSELRTEIYPGLHATRTAAIVVNGETVGHVGEVDPDVLSSYGISGRVAWIEADSEVVLSQIEPVPQMSPISRYPSSEFDLAFVVPNAVPASALESTIRTSVEGGIDLEELTLFDVFRSSQLGEGQRSLAYRLRVSSRQATLTDDQIAAIRKGIIDQASSKHAASLRS